MNYVELHLGDWAQAVAHLSMTEEAVYLRLLRRYYADEKPLPADLVACQRLAGARTPEEREAVQAVLSEFFVLTDEGHRNKRADAEIAKVHAKKGKAAASARARWDANEHKDDAVAMPSNGEKDADAMRSHSEGNAHQTPDTRHQKKEQKHAAASPPPSPADADETLPANVTRIEPVCRIVLEAYHRHLPNCLPAHTLTPKRQRRILMANKLAKALIARKGLGIGPAEFWDGYFAECAGDEWLRGDVPNPKNPRWRQNIDVLLAEDRFGGIMDAALARDLGSPA